MYSYVSGIITSGLFTQKIRVNSADGDQRANPLTEHTEKASLGVNMGAGVYEALSVCGQ